MEALGTAEGETSARSIDILVSRLRKKLGEEAGVLIETARGHGYRFAGGSRRGRKRPGPDPAHRAEEAAIGPSFINGPLERRAGLQPSR